MIRNFHICVVLLVVAGVPVATLTAQVPPREPTKRTHSTLVSPEALKWTPIRPGNEMAVVYGDPSKSGELYAVRFRFADGFKVPAHWHPQDEHATVLQGTLMLGMGTRWVADQLTTTMTVGT